MAHMEYSFVVVVVGAGVGWVWWWGCTESQCRILGFHSTISYMVNSLAPGGFENIFQNVFFKLISWIDTLSNSCETALRSMPQNPSDDKSTLVQVMAWCRQAASHYLSQCCPKSLSPYGVTRLQWVNGLLSNEMRGCSNLSSPSQTACCGGVLLSVKQPPIALTFWVLYSGMSHVNNKTTYTQLSFVLFYILYAKLILWYDACI